MTDVTRFTGSIPEFYDRGLGPVLFEPFARALVERIEPRDGLRVLELAAGTGRVTRHLRERLPASASLVATDLNQAMLDVARTQLAAVDGIEYRVADAQELPFPDGVFDLVVMQFGIMFLPDKDRGAREAFRVLAQGGRYVVSTWDVIGKNPLMRSADDTIVALYPDDPPTFYKTPYGYADPVAFKALLERAGFAEVTVENVKVESRADSAHEFARGCVEGNPVGTAILEHGGTLPPVIDLVVANLRKEFGSDPLRSTMQAWFGSGTRP